MTILDCAGASRLKCGSLLPRPVLLSLLALLPVLAMDNIVSSSTPGPWPPSEPAEDLRRRRGIRCRFALKAGCKPEMAWMEAHMKECVGMRDNGVRFAATRLGSPSPAVAVAVAASVACRVGGVSPVEQKPLSLCPWNEMVERCGEESAHEPAWPLSLLCWAMATGQPQQGTSFGTR